MENIKQQLAKLIYFIRKTIKRNKQCRSICIVCGFYEECKADNSGAQKHG